MSHEFFKSRIKQGEEDDTWKFGKSMFTRFGHHGVCTGRLRADSDSAAGSNPGARTANAAAGGQPGDRGRLGSRDPCGPARTATEAARLRPQRRRPPSLPRYRRDMHLR